MKKKISFVLNDVTSRMCSTRKREEVSLLPRRVLLYRVPVEGKRGRNNGYRSYKLHKLCYVSDFCFSFLRVLVYFTVKLSIMLKWVVRITYTELERTYCVCLVFPMTRVASLLPRRGKHLH